MTQTADALYSLLERLFPITRSITGNGVRKSLKIIQEYVPDLRIQEVPTGTEVYDWTVPDEWNISDAWIADSKGNKLIDFKENGLHVLGYSTPINQTMSFAELEPRLHSLPNMPDAIPYRTSYFSDNWGFCITENQRKKFNPVETYQVVIDSTKEKGSLTYGEVLLEGTSGKEFLISCYCCHPWMANDNQSGVVVATFLYQFLSQLKNRQHSYRIVWVPETIGAITYLSENEKAMQQLDGGFVVTCCGGPGSTSYKESFLGNHLIDRVCRLTFRDAGIDVWERPFAPDGSDERQYSMPAFRIPVGTIAKDKYYDYDEYHTSLDNLDFVTGNNLDHSLQLYIDAITMLENNKTYKSTMPYCEPQLGIRGLYPQTGGGMKQSASGSTGKSDVEMEVDALTWIMFLADGNYDLISMAERSGQPFDNLVIAAQKLEAKGLLTVQK